jgi:hypothetical protein
MSWLYSQALVEEYLGANCLDGEQFVPSSGNPTPQAYLSPDKMTEFSRLSRFGMTFKPLTENLGAAVLTWCQEDSLAKIFQPLEKELASTESEAGCGEKWHASFTKYDPGMRLWKTHQCSLLGDLELFSETWPQWGLMRSGECWEQLTLEQTIRGTESGLSPNGVDHLSHTEYNGTRRWEQQPQSLEKTHGNFADGGEVGLRSPQANRELAGQKRFAKRCVDSGWWDSEPADAPRQVERRRGSSG